MTTQSNVDTVRKMNEAFARNDMEFVLSHCAEDVFWKMEGQSEKRGKAAIRESMCEMGDMEPPTITTDGLFGSGDKVVCHGEMTMKNAEGKEAKYSFCDLYTFAGDQVTELRSFVVEQKPEEQGTPAAA